MSQLGTQPIRPELGDRGITAYLAIERPRAADAASPASSELTRPNSCMTRSSCLRSSWPLSKKTYSAPSEPWIVSLRGRCLDVMTVSVGAKAAMVTTGSPAA